MDKEEQFQQIKDFNDIYVNLPDGAFFALSEEEGISVYDWAWFAEECEIRKTYK